MIETKEVTTKEVVNVSQKIQLVDGQFSPSDASHIINTLIDEKINFHKLQGLTWFEGDHNANTSYCDKREKELREEKLIARDCIKSAKEQGYDVVIDGVLEIKFVKK